MLQTCKITYQVASALHVVGIALAYRQSGGASFDYAPCGAPLRMTQKKETAILALPYRVGG